MALIIKHVADLLGKSFRIPSYQRGYRWERKQIEQLLDDLLEFEESRRIAKDTDYYNREWNDEHPEGPHKADNNESKIGFYCLQPLAVTQTGENSYDVIDGQQRLTTIYLILSYLSSLNNLSFPYDANKRIEEALYELTYQTREKEFFVEKLFKSDINADSNIDFYFMSKAYKTISMWFKSHTQAGKIVLQLLLPDEFHPSDEKRNARLHDVRFIWYDTPVSSSISTFNNLNYGKIGLTAAELIKALLFQCDVYDVENREVARKEAMSRSTKWSQMEENLRNEYFWGMLTSSGMDKGLHIELLLEFVASDIDNTLGYSITEGWDKKDDDWVFNVFSRAISDKMFCLTPNSQPIERMFDRIEYLWGEIQKVYSVLRNWYLDRDLYHKIGLLILLKKDYENKKREDIIRSLYESYIQGTKPQFVDYLRTEIGECVKIKKWVKPSQELQETEAKGRLKRFDEINYEEDPNEIRKILLLFNVQKTIERSKEEMLFPFHLAHELISLEHIHPQHLDESEIKFSTWKEWVDNRSRVLELKGRLRVNKNLSDAVSRLKAALASEAIFNGLDKDQEQQLHQDLTFLDEGFDDLAGMKPEFMHTLYNMALVDGPTNSELNNKLIDQKKKVLKDIQDDSSRNSYIPVGTWYAFNKYFSEDISDMKFWTKPDREAYFSAIKDVYDSYVK